MTDQNVRVLVERLFDSLATEPKVPRCRKCSAPMLSVESTFFAPGGKTWRVALPVCPRCDLKDDTAMFVPDMDC
jgi:hypothetical protein